MNTPEGLHGRRSDFPNCAILRKGERFVGGSIPFVAPNIPVQTFRGIHCLAGEAILPLPPGVGVAGPDSQWQWQIA